MALIQHLAKFAHGIDPAAGLSHYRLQLCPVMNQTMAIW